LIKVRLTIVAAVVIAASAVAVSAFAMPRVAGECAPYTTKPCTSSGGAAAEATGPVKLAKGAKTLDTGETLSCAANVTSDCNVDVTVTAPLTNYAKTVTIAKARIKVPRGTSKKAVVRITPKAQKAIKHIKTLKVTIKTVVHGKSGSGTSKTLIRKATIKVH
jgi:hypothetical protein